MLSKFKFKSGRGRTRPRCDTGAACLGAHILVGNTSPPHPSWPSAVFGTWRIGKKRVRATLVAARRAHRGSLAVYSTPPRVRLGREQHAAWRELACRCIAMCSMLHSHQTRCPLARAAYAVTNYRAPVVLTWSVVHRSLCARTAREPASRDPLPV